MPLTFGSLVLHPLSDPSWAEVPQALGVGVREVKFNRQGTDSNLKLVCWTRSVHFHVS